MQADIRDEERESPPASWGLRRGEEIDETLAVIEPLGGGPRYEVVAAWDRELFSKVAVKVLRPDRVSSERSLAAFEREAMMAEGLRHPNLVRLLRWSARLPRPYIVLEHISAPTLSDVLDRHGALSVAENVLLAIRMLSALHYLHRRSLLHLDVKPGNVTTGDPPRLLDLSVARFAPGPVKLRHSVGTPAYMSPEQCERGHVTPASDVFGLGATLYEALTGMRPFSEGDDGAEAREQRYPQLVEEPLPPREIVAALPPLLDEFIRACLAREPARRPRSAIEAAVSLHRVLEEMGHDELRAWPREVRPA